ncbi:MAG: 50S ribosomal protein L5 [Myxococcales bacterium]|nr:50S ribosomal protein L5 [Myxococcales bacterium]|tara:strand:- start:1370 stop:1912 length:543 start_codon:yes stop_codon:yes gene_type:complete
MTTLYTKYTSEVVPTLIGKFQYRNKMQVPKIKKVVLNMGLGEAIQNPKLIEAGVIQLTAIAGQKPVIQRARKSVATFKLREGMPIGVSVTLRRDRAFEFLDRLINIALPRVRDFRGCSPKAFDGRGNYTLGVKEQLIFPEVDYDTVEKVKGLNICINTTANTDEESRALLELLGFPFRKH